MLSLAWADGQLLLSTSWERLCWASPKWFGYFLWSSRWDSASPSGPLNSSLPGVDADFPSRIEALDGQHVEFLACGASHTALLTKVRAPLSLPRQHLKTCPRHGGKALECGGGDTSGGGRSALPTCGMVLLTAGLCFDGGFY